MKGLAGSARRIKDTENEIVVENIPQQEQTQSGAQDSFSSWFICISMPEIVFFVLQSSILPSVHGLIAEIRITIDNI